MFRGPADDVTARQLVTDRLVLAPPALDHVGPLFDLVGGADRETICSNLLWDGPESPAEIASWVTRQQESSHGSRRLAWVIICEGEVTGNVHLKRHHFPGRALVGYWLGVRHWRRGIMSEALAAVLDLAFGDLDIGKVEGEVFSRNRSSARLLESLGFQREAAFRRAVFKSGEWIDEEVYGILAEEWLAGRPGITT